MQVELKNLEHSQVELTVHMEPEQVEAAIDVSFKKNARRINIPGFRAGKAPRALIERKYGVEVFYDDAMDWLLDQAYKAALDETKINAVDRPTADVKQFERGQEAIMTFTVPVYPEVTLGEYKGVEVHEVPAEVAPADVDAFIERERQEHSRLVVSEDDEVADANYVVIDYVGKLDGEPFEGGSADNYLLKIGSGSFIPGFEEQIIGMKRGQEKSITVTFPADYRAENLAGKETQFEVKLHDIKRLVVPELNDDFAQEVSECETMDAYRKQVEDNLKETAEHEAHHALENAVVHAVTERAVVDIPDAMIEHEIDHMMEDLDHNLQHSGLTLEQYMEATKTTAENLRNQLKDDAAGRVKTTLVLNKIKDQEGITASPEEIDAQVGEIAERAKLDLAKTREALENANQLQDIADSVAVEKTVHWLVEQAKLLPPEPKTEKAEDNPAAE
jgi:trigger factor